MANATRLLLFLGLALCQWAIPGKILVDRQEVVEKGALFRFKTRPVDPSDPFRGKYVALSFAHNRTYGKDADSLWKGGTRVFVRFKTGTDGFARIAEVAKKRPLNGSAYLQAELRSTFGDSVEVDFPFNRYYLEEHKARPVEGKFTNNEKNRKLNAWVEVRIFEGDAVMTDLKIEGKSVSELFLSDKAGIE
jgi:uncharacterized membrane-anchored protein